MFFNVYSVNRNLLFVVHLIDLDYIVLFNSENCNVFDKENPHMLLLHDEQDPHNSFYKLSKTNGLLMTPLTTSSPTQLIKSTDVWNIEGLQYNLQT